MKRPAAAENTLKRIQHWRSICPQLTLRSTFIVGFPGETESEFQECLDFLDAAQLDRVGCFQYSPVEGASANALAGHDEIKQERYARFMQKQQAISRAKLAQKIGSEIQVLVDAVEPARAVARSAADAPEIDGNVIISGNSGSLPGTLKAGDFARVRITASDDYDLYAELTR